MRAPSMVASLTLRSVTTVVTALMLAGCPSPVNDDAIEKLGGECNGVPENEFHRFGQPCVLCHGGYQGDSPTMAVGGTIFATPSQPIPVENVKVTLFDANGESRAVRTNCIGNFFVPSDDWEPAFPLGAQIECPIPGGDDVRTLVMGTRINRDGSCAGCHSLGDEETPSRTYDSPGWIYCATVMPDPPYTVNPTCAGICQ